MLGEFARQPIDEYGYAQRQLLSMRIENREAIRAWAKAGVAEAFNQRMATPARYPLSPGAEHR
jgi:hypothetical protein